ncbi:hypothetical protein N7537_012227 [Penicillium hordei]|uniref:Uncharacterized protein n=1 Tax=Penicillium hordei TaxID=40994 RepID=A0AAD6DNA7_9EURO|nr:uncharacterized protein N7537_012227 [Penicillium hordei]KAJ5589549.1 hypothetical protein N7537_012227 [Penicillium hordei]
MSNETRSSCNIALKPATAKLPQPPTDIAKRAIATNNTLARRSGIHRKPLKNPIPVGIAWCIH